MGDMKTPALILVAGLAITATSFAVDPPPDGGYPGNNTAEGDSALLNLTTNGLDNTAIGYVAMAGNTTGSSNTAVGSGTLTFNDVGSFNVGVGAQALLENETGTNNTALGAPALRVNTSGRSNTAVGSGALSANTTGNENTCVGAGALIGNTGSDNIAIGSGAGILLTNGGNNIDIGSSGIAGEANTIRIGKEGLQSATYFAGIRQTGLVKGSALQVGITADGQLGVRASSARFKEAIKPMDKTSEAILKLKPVTFHYKKELDPKGAPQFGLVAEEVAKVNSDLVVADDQGKPFTVRYEEVNAMLLNEFLKEHKKVAEQAKAADEQAAKVEAQAKKMAAQASKIEELETQLQQMTARLDAKGL